MCKSLTSRLFRTDLSDWNNPWYVYVGAPLLAASGATIGSLWGSHLVRGEVAAASVTGGCILVTMLLGFTLLAAIDRGDIDTS